MESTLSKESLKIIFTDYINPLNSDLFDGSHLFDGSQEYLKIKSIAEELKRLAVETKTAIITGTQTNRNG